MKGLKRLALVTAVSALSSNVMAEVQMLDEDSLQDVTGQAGLTLDVESQWEIGEFAYHDAGYLLIQGIRMGGNSLGNGTGSAGTMLDNLRLEIDIAGDGTDGDNELAYGFSNMRDIAQMYVNDGNTDTTFVSVANGIDSTRDNAVIDDKRTYGDGDLVIHFDFTDGWASEGGIDQYRADGRFGLDDFHTAELVLEHAVDFRLEIDAIGLASSSYELGSAGLDTDGQGPDQGAAGTTTLISQLGIQGYLGPDDLHLENNGNGFDGSGPLGGNTGKADSKIYWGRYFKITDLDVYIDIAGVQISDMEIHNERGDLTGLDGTSSFSFAHSIREIYAVKDAVLNIDGLLAGSNPFVDGIAINTRFKGDIDIHSISFGDTGESIGQLFITDMESTANWIISAHD
ncbi:hypothetical protein A3755_06535 [Oleiphilus sp. HI0085]|nr:hypothetical protein A3741_02040 [Oleiphilus sp. HI0069]KZZ34144.1 hypothetical protein A3755_06535 [Oleiphilus sp. HI0085]